MDKINCTTVGPKKFSLPLKLQFSIMIIILKFVLCPINVQQRLNLTLVCETM